MHWTKNGVNFDADNIRDLLSSIVARFFPKNHGDVNIFSRFYFGFEKLKIIFYRILIWEKSNN